MITVPTLPRLSSLVEVIANGGKIPARSIDAMSARTVYASSVAGVVLDCVLDTGLTPASGTPTDNAAALNAVLATATASSPVHLIIDGGSAIGAPLVIPVTGYVTITGLGWHTGFHVLAASNCNAIQNFPHTDYANNYVWGGLSGWASDAGHIHTGITGENIHLSHFRINGNRGTYPDGNSSGHRDGTITDSGLIATTPDVRGPFPSVYWLTGIVMAHVDNLHIDRVWVYDTPAYHIDLYDCQNYNIHDCRLDAVNPAAQGQTDAIHINGGCSPGFITNITASVGDDVVALNFAEGNGTGGGDVIISGVHAIGCASAVRVFGTGVPTRRVLISDVVMEGCFQQGVLIAGGTGPSGALDTNLSVWISGIDIDFATGAVSYAAAVRCGDHVGHLHIDRVAMISPRKAVPMLTLEQGCAVSSLVLSDCHIHRNSAGNVAAYALLGSAGCRVGNMAVDGFRVTDTYGTANTDIPILFDFTGTAVGLLTVDATVAGVATFISAPSGSAISAVAIKDLSHASHAGSPAAYSVVSGGSTIPVSVGRYTPTNLAGLAASGVSLTGPGLVSGGFPIADALAGNNTVYYSSTGAGLAYKDGAGAVNLFNFGVFPASSYTLVGPSSGTTGVASTSFTVHPNGLYTGTITITPSGGGLSTPIVKTFSSSSAPQTFTIDPPSNGTVTLTGTNSGSLTDPSPLSYVASGGSGGAANAALFVSTDNSAQGQPLTHASATALVTGTGSWSVGAFFKVPVDGTLTTNLEPILSKYGVGNATKEFLLYTTNADSKLNFSVADGAGALPTQQSTAVLTAGTWYFCVGTYDGTKLHLFEDATEQGTGVTATANAGGSAPFMVGGDASSGGFALSGSIAMAFKYSFALSGPQITWLYNAGHGRSTAEILAQSGLTTPDLLLGFDTGGNLGLDSSANAFPFTNAYAVGPSQAVGPA